MSVIDKNNAKILSGLTEVFAVIPSQAVFRGSTPQAKTIIAPTRQIAQYKPIRTRPFSIYGLNRTDKIIQRTVSPDIVQAVTITKNAVKNGTAFTVPFIVCR